ncbi:MAG: ferritin-like domain-containing protein [Thermoplasmatota archaeon]|nr:ferritin-like domain-containing protein [Halobacteriales archaeon]
MPTKQTTKRKPSHAATRGRPAPRSKATAQPELDLAQVEELLLQALETELGGVQVYENAVACAENPDLRREWQKYLDQTRNHVEIVTGLCDERGIATDQEPPGRLVVRHIGESLVEAMRQARSSGGPGAAQLVAAECVVLAESKDHQNWELLKEVAKALPPAEAKPFKEAIDEVEDEEDEHLYHTMGWARELWIESLGLPAVLPPPEERRDVKSAISAARAKKARTTMRKAKSRS